MSVCLRPCDYDVRGAMFPSCSCLAYFPRFAIYKDYRRSTPDRQQIITLTADEFIRHFLLRRDHDQHRDHQLPLSAARSAMPNRPIRDTCIVTRHGPTPPDPHRNLASGDENACISSAQDQSPHRQNRTDGLPTAALSLRNRTRCSQIRPFIETANRRPERPELEILIAHHLRLAG